MSEETVDILLAFCYVMIVAIVVGIIVFILLNNQAKKLKTVYIKADTAKKERRKFVKHVRIALISDMHMPKMPPDKNAVIDAIEHGTPDFVVINGDLCNNQRCWEDAADFVAEIARRTKCKVFITLGNHDIDDACQKKPKLIKDYIEKLESTDSLVRVLVDSCEVTECVGTDRTFIFCGLNDYKHSSQNASNVAFMSMTRLCDEQKEREIILIAHNPDSLLYTDNKIEPTVALFGHTHGGQLWMPFNFEFKFLRKDELPRNGYKYGLHLYKGSFPIYITSGIGCTFLPIRFRTTAEVVFIDI